MKHSAGANKNEPLLFIIIWASNIITSRIISTPLSVPIFFPVTPQNAQTQKKGFPLQSGARTRVSLFASLKSKSQTNQTIFSQSQTVKNTHHLVLRTRDVFKNTRDIVLRTYDVLKNTCHIVYALAMSSKTLRYFQKKLLSEKYWL